MIFVEGNASDGGHCLTEPELIVLPNTVEPIDIGKIDALDGIVTTNPTSSGFLPQPYNASLAILTLRVPESQTGT
jgi:hypothetical protein